MVHAQAATNLVNSSSSTVVPRPLRPMFSLLPLQSRTTCWFTSQHVLLAASTRSVTSRCHLVVTAAAKKPDNPDLDQIQLDDSYYEEIGMTREDALLQQRETIYSVDPEAVALDDISSIDSSSLPDEWKERLAAIGNLQVYGPPALVMAGFRAEEYAVARALLDSLGAHEVKVLPASQELLQSPVAVALAEAEVDWSSPRPPEWIMGGAWGSQRTILFSGLSVKTQATILELLEAQGLPQQVCVTMALAEDQHRKLGEVMAAAVQAQRAAKPPPAIAPWQIPKQASRSSNATSTITTSSSSSGSSSGGSSSSKQGLLSGLPGKRGPLFSRKPAAPAAAGAAQHWQAPAEGLEALQDLISPEMARARLQVSGGDAGLADLIDLGIPHDESDTARLQQQQHLSTTTSSSSSDRNSPDAQSQALLDWITDESTGEVVELPWTEDEQQAAAVVSRMAQQRQQQPQPQGGLVEPPVSLDEILPQAAPPPTAAATNSSGSSFWKQQQQQQQESSPSRQPGSYSSSGSTRRTAAPAPAAAVGLDEMGDVDLSGPSVFDTIQTALRSGVDPERLKQLIDQAAAAGAAAADPIDLLLQEDVAKAEAAAAAAAALKAASKGAGGGGGSSSSSSASSPGTAAAATFGPTPPPAGLATSSISNEADDPMFKLRPEIERAFESNQIKFVDMTKLPSKYKKQYTLAAMQERQRAQQQQLQQQQLQQQQLQQQQETEFAQQLADPSDKERQQLLGDAEQQQQQRWWQQQRSQQQQAMRDGLSASVSGAMPKGKLMEMDVAGGEEMQQGYGAENAMSHDDEDNELDGEWDEAEEGAEALYLDELKLQQLVDSAQQEGLDVSKTLAQALAYGVQIEPEVAAAVGVQLPGVDAVAAAHADIVGSVRELQLPEAAQDEDEGEDIEVAATTVSDSNSAGSSSQPRQWGSGLSAAVGRAKARLAQKKLQQQQQ